MTKSDKVVKVNLLKWCDSNLVDKNSKRYMKSVFFFLVENFEYESIDKTHF